MPSDLELDILSFVSAANARNCSPHTLQQYSRQLAALLAWLAQRGVVETEQITDTDLNTYLIELRQRGLKPTSQHAAFRCFRAFLRWYERTQRPAPGWHNPVHNIQGPRVPKRRLPAPPPEQIKALVDACIGHSFAADRDRALIMFLFDTGIRATECTLLDIGHIGLRRGCVLIVHGKGGRSRHAYPDPLVMKALARYLRHRASDLPADAPLWTNQQGHRLTYWGLRQIVERRAERAGVPMPPLHGFRRAFATAKNEQGVSSIDLQHLLGHADGQTLWRYVDESEAHMEQIQRRTSPVAHYLSGT